MKDGSKKKFKVRILGLSLTTIFIPLDGGEEIEITHDKKHIIKNMRSSGRITVLYNELSLD